MSDDTNDERAASLIQREAAEAFKQILGDAERIMSGVELPPGAVERAGDEMAERLRAARGEGGTEGRQL